jgi:hypothetical protein
MQAIDFLATVVVDILTRIRDILASARVKHPSWSAPRGADEVGGRLQAVQQIAAGARETLTWLNRPRPRANEQMLQRSREAYDRGEGEPVGEIIARLESAGRRSRGDKGLPRAVDNSEGAPAGEWDDGAWWEGEPRAVGFRRFAL